MTELARVESPPRKESFRSRVAGAVAAIAREIDEDVISLGDQAALRRGWETGPGPAFWKLAVRRLEPLGLARGAEGEIRWAVIAGGIVHTRALPRRDPAFGRAAAALPVAEMRLLRLLRSHADSLHRALRGIVTQLAQAGHGFDWVDPALLVLLDGNTGQGKVQSKIARDYYRSPRREGESS